MQQLVNSREKQKDFLVTDVACKELSALGYNCLVQIKRMQQCSYVSTGQRRNEAGGLIEFIFNSDD